MALFNISGVISLCSVDPGGRFWYFSQHAHISGFCFMITGAGHDSKRDTWFFFLRRCYESNNRRAMESTISVPRICTICLVSPGSLVHSICCFHPSSRRRLLFLRPAVFHSLILLYPDIPSASFTDLRPHRLVGSATGGVILKKFILSC